MKKVISTFFILYVIVTSSYTQNENDIVFDLIPPSPQACELGRFGTVPVGLFTGTVQYSIPVFDLKGKNLEIPITLNYSSNGLQVNKSASMVGFDWSLSAGGIINRFSYGKVDNPGTRMTADWDELTDDEKLIFLTNLRGRDIDLQPDIFAYDFLGNTGKFFFDKEGVAQIVSYTSPLEISTNSSGEYGYFKITASDGTIYIFEDVERSGPLSGSPFNSSWHLSKIYHPLGDSVSFYYRAESKTMRVGINRTIMRVTNVTGDDPRNTCSCNDAPDEGLVKTSNRVSYLDSIVYHGVGKVVFNIAKDRTDDITEYKLDSIEIFDVNNNPIKTVELLYQFVNCKHDYDGGLSENNTIYNDYIRMFLKKVKISDVEEDDAFSYNFDYNNITELPPRFSYAQDHKGFFNGKFNTDFVSIDYVLNNKENLFSGDVRNCNRSSDYLFSQKGMLQKITYPTGGYSTFEYEASHTYTVGEETLERAGCRISKIQTYDNETSVPEIKKYNYLVVRTSPIIEPTYYKNFTRDFEYAYGTGYYIGVCKYGILSSNALNSSYIEGQYHVCYPQVELLYGENGENGRQINTFNFEWNSPCERKLYGAGEIYPTPISNDGWASGILERETTKDGASSDLKGITKEYNFEETRNQSVVKCLTYQYRDGLGITSNSELLSRYTVSTYFLYSNWYYLKSETVTDYEDNGNVMIKKEYEYENPDHCQLTKEKTINSKGDSLITWYTYPSDISLGDYEEFDCGAHCDSLYDWFFYVYYKACFSLCGPDDECFQDCLYTRSEDINKQCGGCIRGEEFDFDICKANCNEINNTSLSEDGKAINAMLEKNMIGIPIQTLQKRNDNIIGGSFTTYKELESGLVVPNVSYNIETTEPLTSVEEPYIDSEGTLVMDETFKDKVYYDRYDDYGNLIQAHKTGDIYISYLWGYNHTLPVAKIVGLTYDEVKDKVSLNSIQKKTGEELSTMLETLRELDAMVTIYTYDPLIGMTSMTDENGFTTHYEYDDFGRLKCTRDDDKNIINTYKYHYAGEEE